MIVFRIAVAGYKDDISGNGAALYGARWNSIGTKVVYTASHVSLAILEALVHLNKNHIPDYHLVKVEVPQSLSSSRITIDKIKSSWKSEVDYTQWIGDQFIKNNEALILEVPSVVVPEESNFLLNPQHKDFKNVKVSSTERLELDKRLQQLRVV